MVRVSSPAHNPFSTDPSVSVEGVEPYVSPPSRRGQQYSVPDGYRHHFERSWVVPGRSVLLGLLCVAGLMGYLRSDQLLPLLMGTTTTRVVAVDRAASADVVPQQASVFPLDFPATLPPTAAGPATGAGGGGGVVKCVQQDGAVVYQQHRDCGSAATAARALQGAR